MTLDYAGQSIAAREGSSSPNGLHGLYILKVFVNAAFAFAILGWITALAGTAVAALSLVKPSMLPAIIGVIIGAVCCVFLLVSWPIVAALLNNEYCNDKLKVSYEYDYGFAFLLIAWILSIGWVAFEVLGMMGLIPGAAAPVSEANSG